jgi:hypothetical protein
MSKLRWLQSTPERHLCYTGGAKWAVTLLVVEKIGQLWFIKDAAGVTGYSHSTCLGAKRTVGRWLRRAL